MSKKLKFIFIIFLSLVISASAAYALTELPSFEIFPANYDYAMPEQLLEKLRTVDKLSIVRLGQHGYTHGYNETQEDILKGYDILTNYSLHIDYFIPTYQQAALPYETPAEQFYIPEREEGIYYAKERMDYGPASTDGKMTLAIHVQDDIIFDWLDEITADKNISYLRVDDINTDIVDIDKQINRMYTAISFCGSRNCTVVLGIIPHVSRMYESDKTYLFFNKTMIIVGVMLLLPIYLFYFLSYYLSWWLK
jgi:hypothetical protein